MCMGVVAYVCTQVQVLLKGIDITTPTKLKTQMTVTTQSGLWEPKPGTLGGAENTLNLLMSELSPFARYLYYPSTESRYFFLHDIS